MSEGKHNMWTSLKGWDRPSEENAARCRLFQKGRFEQKGVGINYRYFASKEKGSLPLVVFLHGADAVGDDNDAQISYHDVGTVFVDEQWQKKHPCHVLAPQYTTGKHWTNTDVSDCLQALIEDMVQKTHADQSRIYIYGYSAGAVGLFGLLKKHPDYYAAAIPICGSTLSNKLEELAKTPIWMFHAEDDIIVPSGDKKAIFGSNNHLGSHVLYEELKKIPGAKVKYTEYATGEMMDKYGLHSHCSWVLMGQDEKAKEWLFSIRNPLFC